MTAASHPNKKFPAYHFTLDVNLFGIRQKRDVLFNRLRQVLCGLFLLLLMIQPLSCPGQLNVPSNRQSVNSRTPNQQVSRSPIHIPVLSEKSRTYNSFNRALYFFSIFWGLLGQFLFIKLRFGPRLVQMVDRKQTLFVVPIAIIVAAYLMATTLWHMPVGLLSFWHEKMYGFATHSIWTWLIDHAINYAFGLVMVPGAIVIYWLANRSPKRWWLLIWGVSIPWQIGMVFLWPIVVAPSYNDFRPIDNRELDGRLRELARKAGIPDARVYQVDISRRTTRLNAYFSGIGPSKRIVLWDTTLKTLSPDEIEAIMGHEIGHYVLRHTYWNIVISIGGAFVILWILSRMLPWVFAKWGTKYGVRGMNDPVGLPLAMLALTIVLLVQTPIEAAISRYQEHAADRYGLELTGKHEAMARAFIQFVEHDFSDPDPPTWVVWWSYSHPPLKDRVEFALNGDG